jgi:hypothetical protein
MLPAAGLDEVPDPDQHVEDVDSDVDDEGGHTGARNHPCVYCDVHQSHPQFLYFISTRPSHITDADVVNKYHNYIGCSRQPLARIATHNREKQYKVGAKITRAGAGCWTVEMVVGPVPKGHGKALKELWKGSYRTITRRLLAGTLIASTYSLEVFVRDASTHELIVTLINKLDNEPGLSRSSSNLSDHRFNVVLPSGRDVPVERDPLPQLSHPQERADPDRQDAARQEVVLEPIVVRQVVPIKRRQQRQDAAHEQEIQG